MKHFVLYFGGLAMVVLLVVADNANSSTQKRRIAEEQLRRCMLYLPALRNEKLFRWCLKHQERMP